MSRPIKFRVWDTFQEKFIDEYYLLETGIEQLVGFRKSRLVFLQFTTFNDMDGVPICEEDIVKFVHKPGETVINSMDDPAYGYKIIRWIDEEGRLGFFNMDGQPQGSGYCFDKSNCASSVKVVGNTFESHKLMELGKRDPDEVFEENMDNLK